MSEVELFATAISMCGCAGVVMGLSAMPNGKYLGGLTDGLGVLLTVTWGASCFCWIAWMLKILNDFGTIEAVLAVLITVAFRIVADRLHIHRDGWKKTLLNPKKLRG